MSKTDKVFELLDGMNELRDAKELLDEILVAYDIYGQEFNNSNIFDKEKLNIKIRKYMDFDDSE